MIYQLEIRLAAIGSPQVPSNLPRIDEREVS